MYQTLVPTDCPRFEMCPVLPIFVDNPTHNLTYQPYAEQHYYERYSPFPHGSIEWKTVNNKRVSVERAFSRLKSYRKRDAIRTRQMTKVWLHVSLSVVVVSSAALANIREDLANARKVTVAAKALACRYFVISRQTFYRLEAPLRP